MLNVGHAVLLSRHLYEAHASARGHSETDLGAISSHPERGGYVTNVTESQLKDAPEFSGDSRQDRDWKMRWHQHFHTTPCRDERSSARQTTNPMNPSVICDGRALRQSNGSAARAAYFSYAHEF
jgi:hypothetical protein